MDNGVLIIKSSLDEIFFFPRKQIGFIKVNRTASNHLKIKVELINEKNCEFDSLYPNNNDTNTIKEIGDFLSGTLKELTLRRK
jgi:hypothetical protein